MCVKYPVEISYQITLNSYIYITSSTFEYIVFVYTP